MNKKKIKHSYIIALLIIIPSFLTQCTLFYASPKKTNAKYIKQAPYDVIIVPGFPHDTTNWHMIVQMRVLWANDLYKRGIAKNIMFSGSAVYSPYVESKVMARYVEALGVPSKNIYIEENAEHSTENLYFSYIRAKELGFKKIALASDSFQTNNLRLFKKRFHIDVALLPIVFKKLKTLDHTEPHIDVKDLFIENFISITEIETFGERIQGTLGNQIRWREEDLTKRQIIKQRKRGMLIPRKEKI